MRFDGLPLIALCAGIVSGVALGGSSSVTRVHPTEHVYQVQLLGKIMLVCPETFGRTSDAVNCDRWMRRTHGGTTVFVGPIIAPEPSPAVAAGNRQARFVDVDDVQNVVYMTRPRPRARPDNLQ